MDGQLIVTGGRRGTLYGVYELLERVGGVRFLDARTEHVPHRDAWTVPADLSLRGPPVFSRREIGWAHGAALRCPPADEFIPTDALLAEAGNPLSDACSRTIPADEQYHWHYVGRMQATPTMYFYAHHSWVFDQRLFATGGFASPRSLIDTLTPRLKDEFPDEWHRVIENLTFVKESDAANS